MPEVPESLFLDGLKALLRVDQRWVPAHGSGALYVRPVLFSVDSSIRVKPAERFLFVVFTCPFAAYYGAAVDVLVTRRYVRAFPGGTGDTKPAGNYAPTFWPTSRRAPTTASPCSGSTGASSATSRSPG